MFGWVLFWIFLGTVGSGIIASNKNRSVGWWVCLGAFFGLFAFVTVLLLPPIVTQDWVTSRSCPHCLSIIPRHASVCRYCQRDVSALPTTRPAARP